MNQDIRIAIDRGKVAVIPTLIAQGARFAMSMPRSNIAHL